MDEKEYQAVRSRMAKLFGDAYLADADSKAPRVPISRGKQSAQEVLAELKARLKAKK